MDQGHQVPEQPKQEPGPGEGGGEQEELVTPLHVQEGRPEVAEVQGTAAAHMLNEHVAPAVLGEHAAPPAEGAAVGPRAIGPPAAVPGPQGAQQGFGDIRLRLGVAELLGGGVFRGGGRGRGHVQTCWEEVWGGDSGI